MRTLSPSSAAVSEISLFQHIVDTSDDGIAALDSSYRYVCCNNAYQREFQRLFGISVKPGMLLDEALANHPDELAAALTRWGRALNGEEFTTCSTLNGAEGQRHQVESRFWCVRDTNGSIVFAFQRARDLTDKLALSDAMALLDIERRDEYLRLAESAANVGLWHWDAESGHAEGSPEWRRLLGLTPDSSHVRLADLLAVVHSEDTARLRNVFEEASTQGDDLNAEFRAVHGDGTIRWLLTQGRLVRDSQGAVRGMFGVTVDITERKRYEDDLTAVTQRLEAHLENTPMAVIEYAPDFTIVRFSGEAERLFGWKASEVVGQRLFDIPWVHEDDVPKIRQALDAMVSGRTLRFSGTNRNYRKDGSVVYCEWFNSAILDAEGNRASVLSCAADLTARHLAEAALLDSECKFRTTFELAGVGMARVGLDGRLLEVNRKFCEILGYTHEELLAQTYVDLTHPDDREFNQRLFARALAGETDHYTLEKRYLHKSGASVWTDLTSALVRTAEGEALYFISVVAVSLKRKAAEAALRRSNEDLRNFAYAAAHDLQEPLRTVSTHTQLIARRLESALDPETTTLMSYVVDGAARLEELIRALREYLDISYREDGRIEPVDLNAALERGVRQLDPAIRSSGAVLHAEPLPSVEGVESHFVQLFQHLISNSIKYARPGDSPDIRVTATRSGQDWVMTVTDNGIGIAPPYHKRVFGVFKRLHGPQVPGTGMGLAICANIVERYGGRMWVESEEGKGAAFSFTVPDRRD